MEELQLFLISANIKHDDVVSIRNVLVFANSFGDACSILEDSCYNMRLETQHKVERGILKVLWTSEKEKPQDSITKGMSF